jgi:CubicO group peptidase (beta-lactamase class C family)
MLSAIRRRAALLAVLLAACLPGPARAEPPSAAIAEAGFPAAVQGRIADEARALEQLNAIIVAQDGRTIVEERLRGMGLDQPVNIKSASKTIIAALVGRAIAEGLLEGVDQPVTELLADDLPAGADPRLARLTVGDLLSMQAGLERTSGANYGSWAASPNWVRDALARPFVDEPGGRMLYSTGNTHLLSAILTKVSGRSTRALFQDRLAEPLGIEVGGWDRDPQGIYLGGNNMALSPRGLLAFGEMIRRNGATGGEQLVPADWIEESWTPRTRSVHSGDRYGYGWFIRTMRGHDVYYAWGYGGQMLYIVPDLSLTVVITSDADTPSGRTGYVDDLHRLVAETIIPAAEAASG